MKKYAGFKLYVLAFSLALIAGSLASIGLQGCTPAQRQAVVADVAKQARACADEPVVKACVHAVFTQCYAEEPEGLIAVADDRCITKETAQRIAGCFELCGKPLGEAGAPGQ